MSHEYDGAVQCSERRAGDVRSAYRCGVHESTRSQRSFCSIGHTVRPTARGSRLPQDISQPETRSQSDACWRAWGNLESHQWLTKRSQLPGGEQSSAICWVWTVPAQGRISCPTPALFDLFLLAGLSVIRPIELTRHDLLEAGSSEATLQHLRLG